MKRSKYSDIKNIFIDSVDKESFVELDSTAYNYQVLKESLDKPLKMILLFGKPGTGKSMILNKLYHDLKNSREVHYFDAPILSEKEFLKRIYEGMSSQKIPQNMRVNFDGLIKYCQNLKGKREVMFFLDECQLYSEALMEKIRLLSDTRVVKFVITLHKTENEEVIAKEHFKTRIWEIIELKNASFQELEIYIQKKLLKKSFVEVSNMITKKNIKFIHTCTKGNFRETNKFLYTIFNIYEYYDMHKPEKIRGEKLSKKILEMTAIKIGYIND
ncbi:MSHA biogenesis protein MshM [hydrothermal vent metagenome]|uniref:MSHA biogenesis protein MshM n=1 Tax=hydrothermal vent metagenome TaxID=652676 RepID=A0A1W1CNN2_9ZZZZ